MEARTFALHRILAALVCVLASVLQVHAASEEVLLELWQDHIAKPDGHEEAIKACRAFAKANAGDPLLPIVEDIEAWHHFRAGRTADALKLVEPHLTAPRGPVADAARAIAQGWFTRLDREKVAAALQLYYRREIAYPKTLDLLAKHPKIPADARPPFIDRFGQQWNYRLTGLAKATGFTDQKYSLQSMVLGDLSDMKSALAAPYASRITAVPAQIIPAPGGASAVKFSNVGKGGTAIVAVGQASGDLHVAFAGAKIVVVSDFTHWKIFPKP
jgi:hypothetical protein